MYLQSFFLRIKYILFLSLLAHGLDRCLGSTVYQGPGSSFIAFEAESLASITNSPPTTWVLTNEPSASSGVAIYQQGVNQTASSSSFALYSLVFTQPGTYSIYYRWRADKLFSDKDPHAANSFRLPLDFGDLANDPTSTNFVTAAVNNKVDVPAANSYNVYEDAETYTVTQADIDAAVPLTFKIGTREAGMFIDRFVLSTNAALLEADFNAIPNSNTDLVQQGPIDGFVAFQAERVTSIQPGSPTTWIVTNESSADAGRALYQQGANQTGTPSSFAYYTLKFAQPGVYSLYYRWRADKLFSDRDPHAANSFRVPVDFGDLVADPTSTNFVTASVNNQVDVPAANSYNVFEDAQTYTVTTDEVNAGAPLIFKIGTREAGMFLDRFVLSTNTSLSESDFNALPDSGTRTPPRVLSAVGSPSLTTVRVTFDLPLAANAADPAHFQISGGVSVTAANLDPVTLKDIYLTTSAQKSGTNYVVTVNQVSDVTGGVIANNSTVRFTAWQLSSGWVTREFYLNVDTNQAGGGVADLVADPKYPDHPSSSDIELGFRIHYQPSGNNYGARVRAYFIPPISGHYVFYAYNDAAVTLNLSSDDSPANLALLLDSPNVQLTFDASVSATTGPLAAGKRYLLEALFRQNTGLALMGVAATIQGDPTAPADLPVLGGDLISTWVNPDAGIINITRQPSDVTAPAGGHATLSVAATTPNPPLFYQWLLNGQAIPNATRASYTTPVLRDVDSGLQFSVVVSAAGASVTSRVAQVTVVPGQPTLFQPYIGVNFVGVGAAGIGGGDGGILYSNDVTGVIQQANFNDVTVTTATDLPLFDSAGAATPVTLNYSSLSLVTTGTGVNDAEHALFQGYLHNNNSAFTVTLNNVPQGTYSLILYSVGFNFNATYEQQVDLTGATSYTTYHVQAEDANQYAASPGFVRMTGTDPNNRGAVGNYVEYDNVSPAADASLAITLTPESTFTGSNYLPPLNGFQLVKIVPVPPPLVLGQPQLGPDGMVLSWSGGVGPYLIQFKQDLKGQWLDLVTTSSLSTTIPTVLDGSFYRVTDRTAKTVHLFRANLTPGQEVQTPAVSSPTGVGNGFLSLEGSTATYFAQVSGLTSDAIAAHLHGPAPAGVNAGVYFHLLPSPNIPPGNHAHVSFAGSQQLTPNQLTALLAGQTYFNVHTHVYPMGELRGQLIP